MDNNQNKFEHYFKLIGTAISIITMGVFMFTAKSFGFTMLAMFSALFTMFLYEENISNNNNNKNLN